MTIEAWYMDASEADQRLQHRQEPNVPVSSEELNALGVLQWSLTGSEDDAELAKIREARGYSYKDVVDIHKDRMPGYETKLKTFFEEHIHTDEEIRYILDGR
jgi:1,2-dihydroxy-3-keto-5-methylthiopentene dioxygenase